MIDIAGSIATAGEAIKIVKAIRDADQAMDKAVLKGQLAEVLEALSDNKIALLEARERINELETELKNRKIAPGEKCDFCGAFACRMISEERARGPQGDMGVTNQVWKCSSCEKERHVRGATNN